MCVFSLRQDFDQGVCDSGVGGGFDKQRANVIWCCRVAQMLGARAQHRAEEEERFRRRRRRRIQS